MRKVKKFKDIKILVYDDEQGIVDTMRIILNRDGFMVDGATNAKDAIQKLKENNYDMLILDYFLEKDTAEQFINIIRTFSDIYIILLTGNPEKVQGVDVIDNIDIQSYCEKDNDFNRIRLQVKTALNLQDYYLRMLFHNLTISEILPMMRELRGETQEDLANAIGVSRATVVNIENGYKDTKYDTLKKIADHYNVSVDFLTGRFIMNGEKIRK